MIVDQLIRQVYGWACERLYYELAWSYDLVSRLVSAGAWPAWRRLALDEIAGARVLEIGFGTGELLAEMAGRWQVCGLELSPAMQCIAARRLDSQPLAPPRVQAPAQAMPFADGAFDTILATFPTPYILAAATLAECWRVLATGGRLVVGGLWVTPRCVLLGRWLPVFYADPMPPQRASVAQRFAAAGFHVQWRVRQGGWAQVPLLVAEKGLPVRGPYQDG
jgi:SAM-dependent methyltransferase